AASTVRRSARVPSRCPASTGTPWLSAQRPLPSMMMATLRATPRSGCDGAGSVRDTSIDVVRARRPRAGNVIATRSHLHDLRFLVLEQLVDTGGVLVGELLYLRLRPALLVVADVAVADELLEMAHHVAADVAHCHLALLGEAADELDQLLAPLLGQLR